MPSRDEIHYFGAGPAPLPTAVLEAASQALLNYKNQGVGLCEMSHRSADANQILADAKAALATLLDIPDSYDILFLQGGGSGGFSEVVYHLVGVWVERRRQQAVDELSKTGVTGEELDRQVLERLNHQVAHELKLDYLVTGSWSLKASQEAARLVGKDKVNVAVDARTANGGKFGKIPAEDQWSLTKKKRDGGPGSAFVYFCDNETVDGVEFPSFPRSLETQPEDAESDDAPLVIADMSSNFISRRVDVSKYAVIFGGAQKNIGNTGVTIVIVRKSLLPPEQNLASADLLRQLNLSVGPIVFDWPTIAKNNSLYNTLPIFDVWIAGQVMSNLVNTYGAQKISGQETISNEKARILYGILDDAPETYTVVPDKTVRSRMNLCVRVGGGDAAKEKAFLEGAEKRGLFGLKGHRSVGGIRISNYNAVTMDGVRKLAQYLQEFAKGSA